MKNMKLNVVVHSLSALVAAVLMHSGCSENNARALGEAMGDPIVGADGSRAPWWDWFCIEGEYDFPSDNHNPHKGLRKWAEDLVGAGGTFPGKAPYPKAKAKKLKQSFEKAEAFVRVSMGEDAEKELDFDQLAQIIIESLAQVEQGDRDFECELKIMALAWAIYEKNRDKSVEGISFERALAEIGKRQKP